jgi:hypothetical protein
MHLGLKLCPTADGLVSCVGYALPIPFAIFSKCIVLGILLVCLENQLNVKYWISREELMLRDESNPFSQRVI